MQKTFDRIAEETGAKTQVQLADLLGIRQSSISDARRRESIPSDWLIKLLRLYWLNPGWVLTGEGAKYLKTADDAYTPPAREPEPREPGEGDKILCAAEIIANALGMLSENMQRRAVGSGMAYTAADFINATASLKERFNE